MKILIYDFEVLKYDWIVVFQDYQSGSFEVFHNDGEGVLEFMEEDPVYIGFNSKGYDQYIMKAVCGGCDTDDIKELNDFIISGGNGWEHPLMSEIHFRFNNVDIMDDMQAGLSLKAIEGHLGMSIEESSIDFNVDHPLSDAELEELVHYCKHDVEATAQLVKLRENYLKTKLNVGRMVGLDDHRSLAMTNAKLTAAFLKARKPLKPWGDEREYKYPENLKLEYIPQEVIEFFDNIRDMEIPSEELFKRKLDTDIGGTPTVIGFGGIHSAIPNIIEDGRYLQHESNPEL